MKKTLLYLFLGMFGLCQQAGATGPLRRTYTVKQSDGTYLQLQKHGNGKYVFYTTTDGIALMRGSDGDYQYAMPVKDGMKPTGVCAHEASERKTEDLEQISAYGMSMTKAYQWMNTVFKETARNTRGMGNFGEDGLGIYGQTGCGIVKSIGSPVIPVVMVEFPDRKFMDITTPEKVGRMLNEKGYHDEKFCVGSVRDYFISQSNGLFQPTYKVVAKVMASHPYAYYGENYSNGGIDKNVRTLIREAIDLAYASGVDFKEFAKDAGRVPLVSVYYAGPGEHSAFEEGCENYIWAHFSQTSFSVGGVGINSYFVGNEMMQDYKFDENLGVPVVSNQKFDGIGIFCHEFGHALGLPDFYKTSGSAEEYATPDFWSVMDYGQYFYDGYAPVGYSAFERSSLGWLDIKELTTAQMVKLYPFGQEDMGATAYCIKNDKNPKEYYILENRQTDTWYPDLMGHGMLITHVDYDMNKWLYNTVNNDKNHQCYEVVPADNVKDGHLANGRPVWDYFKADLFPGLNKVTSFTDKTTPAAKVYTGGYLGKPIYAIKEKEGVVTFSYLKELEIPDDTTEVDSTNNSLFIPNQDAFPGMQLEVPVMLDNKDSITAIQFDLYLPEGIKVALDEDSCYLIDLAEERVGAHTHTVNSELHSNGAIRVISFSAQNAVFKGNSGKVFKVMLQVGSALKAGDYTVEMKNIVLSTSEARRISLPETSATIAVNNYHEGDVNNDGFIDVTDISSIVTYILGKPSPDFIFVVADVNRDGVIDVSDISGEVNFILKNKTLLNQRMQNIKLPKGKTGLIHNITSESIR